MNYPTFRHHAIVLESRMLRYRPHDDVIFPSVVSTAGRLANALGRYYMYYAPHDAPGGICLAYADQLTGPWMEYEANPVIGREWSPHYKVGHVSGPHALWVAEQSRFFLYFHGENDTTRLASTADGIRFEYDGVAVTTSMYQDISEASYARVFEYAVASRGTRYVLMFMGNNKGTRRIYLALSRDGRTWEPQPKPLISPPPGTGVTQVGAPWYLPYEGRHFVIFHGDKTGADLRDLTSDLYIAEVGPDFDREVHLGVFYSRTQIAEDNARVSDPCIVHDNGQPYLFTAVGGRLNQRIAVAVPQ